MKKTRKRRQKWADSMGQAASMMGMELADIKAVKRKGAPGFVGSRVDMETLEKWIEEQDLPDEPPEGAEDLESKDILERRRIKEQWLKARTARLREDKLMFHRDDLVRDGARIGTALAAMLDAIIAEVPHWVGLSPAEASRKAKEKAAALRAMFQEEAESLWGAS